LFVKRAVITNETSESANIASAILVYKDRAAVVAKAASYCTEVVHGKNPKFKEELFRVQIDNCEVEPFVLELGNFGEIIARYEIYASKWRDG